MTSSVHEFVAKHRTLERDAAFALLLAEEPVKSAIARSPDLEARLAQDFQRAWVAEQAQTVEIVEDLGDLADIPDLEEPAAPPPTADARATPLPEARFLCPGCGKRALVPHLASGIARVGCAGCGFATENVLSLVPVKETGALEYLFGAGWRRAAYPSLAATVLAGAFLALRWMRL